MRCLEGGGEGIQDIPAEIEKGVIMGAYDWTSGLVTFGTQLAPGIIAVGLALMAALAARTKAMPALVFASGLSTALSLVGGSYGAATIRTRSRGLVLLRHD